MAARDIIVGIWFAAALAGSGSAAHGHLLQDGISQDDPAAPPILLSEEDVTSRILALHAEASGFVAAHRERNAEIDVFGDEPDSIPPAAAQRFREALELGRTNLGNEHPVTIGAMYQLATFYSEFRRTDQAREIAIEIVAIDQRLDLSDYSDAMALVRLLDDVSELELTEHYLRRALELSTGAFGRENSTDIIIILGEFLLRHNRFDEAEPLILEAQRLLREISLQEKSEADLQSQSRAVYFITDEAREFEEVPVPFPAGFRWRTSQSLPQDFVEWKLTQIQQYQLPLIQALRLEPLTSATLLEADVSGIAELTDIQLARLVYTIREFLMDQDRWREWQSFPDYSDNFRERMEVASQQSDSAWLMDEDQLFVDRSIPEFDNGRVLAEARSILRDRGEQIPELLPIRRSNDTLLNISDDELFSLQYEREAEQIRSAISILERANGPVSEPIVAALLHLARYNSSSEERPEIWAEALRRGAQLPADAFRRFAKIASFDAELFMRGDTIENDSLRQSEHLLRISLEAMIGRFGTADVDVLNMQFVQTRLFERLGRLDDAIQLHEEMLDVANRSISEDLNPNFDIAGLIEAVFVPLRELYHRTGRHNDEAVIVDRYAPADNPVWLSVFPGLAASVIDYHHTHGRHDREANTLAETIRMRETEQSGDSISTIAFRVAYANALLEVDPMSSRAFAPIAVAMEQIRARWSGGVFGFEDEAQLSRETAAMRHRHTLFANAAWASVATGSSLAESVEQDVFNALQNDLLGPASRAVANTAIQRMAGDQGSSVQELVTERAALQQQLEVPYSDRRAPGTNEEDASEEELWDLLTAEPTPTDYVIRSQISEIEAQLRDLVPDYFALVSPEPLDLQSAQAMLGPDEAILLIVPSDLGTHTIAISSTAMSWHRSDLGADYLALSVRRLLWDVGARIDSPSPGFVNERNRRHVAGQPYPFDRGTAYQLYRELVAPMNPVLSGKRHVFVSAGGVLASLPFGILVTDEPQGRDDSGEALRETSWFADAHALTHIPSVQSLHLLRRAETQDDNRRNGFRGFGDPTLNGVAETRGASRGLSRLDASTVMGNQISRSGGAIADIEALRRLTRLPGTADELENMRQVLGAPPSSVLLGDDATETAVRTADLSNVGIVAFATHGLMASDLSPRQGIVEAGLVFTPPGTASEDDDGFLAASEVTALRLNATWVILSACNTATSDGDGSYGLSGLARAFFYAGARNLLATHWYVDDAASAFLTVRTIELQREDNRLSGAAALQQAMREVRNNSTADSETLTWAHPAFWAPFVLIGDGAQ